MRITVDEARGFFEHASQQIEGLTPDILPGEGFEYYAKGPLCVAFHLSPWPDVWFCHYGVKPEGWGGLVAPAQEILAYFFELKGASRIIGWTPEDNRAACAFAKRVGFSEDGKLKAKSRNIIMQGWTPWG